MDFCSPPVVITGFMGAGKTTVARALARRLRAEALDLDEYVTALTGRTPQEWLEGGRESSFRAEETAALGKAFDESAAKVIALGGGTWTVEANRALIEGRGCATVWLDAPFELCWARVRRDGDRRPLARDEGQARALYESRRRVYALARHRVEVSAGASADGLAGVIAGLLGERAGGRTEE